MLLLSELIDVMLDTEVFFREAGGWTRWRALGYFAFISLLALLINWTLLWVGVTPAGLIPFEKILAPAWELAWYIPVAYLVMGFFFVGFYTLLVQWMLRKQGVSMEGRQVLKTVAYGFTPAIVTLWIPVLGLLLVVWSLYMMILGLGVYNQKPLQENARVCIAGAVVTGIIIFFFLLGLGIYLLALTGGEAELLWTILIPL